MSLPSAFSKMNLFGVFFVFIHEIDFKPTKGGEGMENAEFERLLASCEKAVQRFVYCRLPSKADAEDVWQETLLAAYRSRHSVTDAQKFKPWLLRIAVNKCNDFYRERAARDALLLEELPETELIQSRRGLTETVQTVQDTLERLAQRDAQILRLFFLENLPQAKIAEMLGIPLGTVKSRLHTAKQRFRALYPDPPQQKEKESMKKLPEYLPQYTIEKSEQAPFPVRWEEIMGWFLVPRLGEALSWAMYDFPERKRTEDYRMEVIGRASVHGIEGVEITAQEHSGGIHESVQQERTLTRGFVAQLTDTHCRLLAENHEEDGVRRFSTFLDTEEFIPNWGFGADNCGNEVDLRRKGLIQRQGSQITAKEQEFLLDVVGRYTVTIGGKTYDTVCVVDIECYNGGVLSEQFLDQNGRTVLWRRFNRDDWAIRRYKKRWTEALPNNERLYVNGEVYVHWYDCITDYIL